MERSVHPHPGRITGFDLARGIAVLGMFLMNFKIVMVQASPAPNGLDAVLTLFEGRFAVLFIILAGIGVSLMTARAREAGDPVLMRSRQKAILARAGFLFVAGLGFALVWQADILHYYGVYMALAAVMLFGRTRYLLLLALLLPLAFVLAFFFFDWTAGWNWELLTYKDFWTFQGFMKNTVFNGFHPVLPWLAFFLFGMAAGRARLSEPMVQTRLFWGSLAVFGSAELAALVLAPVFGEESYMVATLSFPPFPLFVLSGCAGSLAIICLCLILTRHIPAAWTNPITATGQMALTHYILHVILGMGLLDLAGRLYGQTLGFCMGFTALYFSLSVLFSRIWLKQFTKGPLEALMRRITG